MKLFQLVIRKQILKEGRKEWSALLTKNPGIAAVLSVFWTGVGQIYNGQIIKGLILIVVQMINAALMWVLIGFVTYPIVWIWGIYDAYKTAERMNRRSDF